MIEGPCGVRERADLREGNRTSFLSCSAKQQRERFHPNPGFLTVTPYPREYEVPHNKGTDLLYGINWVHGRWFTRRHTFQTPVHHDGFGWLRVKPLP